MDSSGPSSKVSGEWRYILVTISAFAFAPALGRVSDWVTHHSSRGAFDVIPLVMLLPIAIFVIRRRRKLRNQTLLLATVTWVLAFGYAALIAIARGAISSAFYDIAQFVFPLLVGLWLLTQNDTPQVAHERLARLFLVLGGIAGAYGIFQYIVAPPWDTQWLLNADADSFGTPEKFGIRVFSILNGPGVFALFVGAVTIFAMPYIRLRNIFSILALLLMIVGMLLSLVRTAWVVVALGIVLHLLFSHNRMQSARALATISVLCALGLVGLIFFVPNANIGEKLAYRFSTFLSAQDDQSVRERRATASETFMKAVDNPVGAGLGLTGSAVKLTGLPIQMFSGAPPSVIDNGFASRFFEMGVIGFAGFLLVSLGSIFCTARLFVRSRKLRDERSFTTIFLSCTLVEIIIFVMNFAGDGQQGLLGIMFFAALAIAHMKRQHVAQQHRGLATRLPSFLPSANRVPQP